MNIEQTYEIVRIDDEHDPLKEHPDNPRRGDVDVISESIDVNGWYGAVTAQKSTGYILAGNHRYRVAKEKGAREIPVIWMDVDDERARHILLVDNKSADMGDYDEAQLEELLASLESLDGTGYTLASVQETIESANGSAAPEADAPEIPEGDILDPDDIPDDVHVPQYGVMVVCKDEERQRFIYEFLKAQFPLEKLQVVAV